MWPDLPALSALFSARIPLAFIQFLPTLTELTIDEVLPGLGFTELQPLFVGLIRSIYLGEKLHVDGLDDTDVGDEARHSPRSVSAPREAKAEYLISRLVVQHNKVVGFNDVFSETGTDAALPTALRRGEVARSDARVVVDELVELSARIVAVAPDASNESAQLSDVGRDIVC